MVDMTLRAVISIRHCFRLLDAVEEFLIVSRNRHAPVQGNFHTDRVGGEGLDGRRTPARRLRRFKSSDLGFVKILRASLVLLALS